MNSPIAHLPIEAGGEEFRRVLGSGPVEAVEIARPPLEQLPYRKFVAALLRVQGFKLDLHGQDPASALAMLSDRLIGPGTFEAERESLVQDIDQLIQLASAMVGGPAPMVALRSIFAPGDTVWHVDRLAGSRAYRLLWPIGRPAGMQVTAAANIDRAMHFGFMRREHPLLCRLDTLVVRTGGAVEQLWRHRPLQLAAMQSGAFPYIVDPQQVFEISPGAASVHRVETSGQGGTYHRSSWANRMAPGLQIVITAASD